MVYKRGKKVELCSHCGDIVDDRHHDDYYCEYQYNDWLDDGACDIYDCCGYGPLSEALLTEVYNAIGAYQSWSKEKQLKVLQNKDLKIKYSLLK